MKKLIIGMAVMLVVFASLQVQAAVTTNEIIPFTTTVFVSCALDGAGEFVALTGELHVLVSATVSKSGMSHSEIHSQPANISGNGLTSGDRYQGTGVTRTGITMDTNDGFPHETTFVNNFRIIGQGPGNNFTVHQTVHITIDANGNVTANIDNTKTDCN